MNSPVPHLYLSFNLIFTKAIMSPGDAGPVYFNYSAFLGMTVEFDEPTRPKPWIIQKKLWERAVHREGYEGEKTLSHALAAFVCSRLDKMHQPSSHKAILKVATQYTTSLSQHLKQVQYIC